MLLKKFIPVSLILCVQLSSAQKPFFSENFDSKKMDSSWQIISGNWHIGDVDEMRIAPAEGGYRYVLCTDNKNNKADNLIRLFVDLPDSLRLKMIKLSFYYYFNEGSIGSTIEGEFYQKEIKDGLRGRPWTTRLSSGKRRWTLFQKILRVPANTNSLRLVFTVPAFPGKKDKIACFDNLQIYILK